MPERVYLTITPFPSEAIKAYDKARCGVAMMQRVGSKWQVLKSKRAVAVGPVGSYIKL